jgi:tripartite-type tricarboxylate transporter receptor subunit TctC
MSKTTIRALSGILAAIAFVAAVVQSAEAEDGYPSRPIRLIVPYPAGGPADTIARVFADRLFPRLGQRFIVDNRPGAAGAIGLEAAAKSTPDGYTLVIGTASTHTVNPLVRQLPYDARKDFAPLSLVTDGPIVFSANPGLPVKSLQELIDYSKKNPDQLNFGSDGQGSLTHLAGELLKVQTGLRMVHIPYKGTAQPINDVVAGQIQLSMTGALNAISLQQSGKLRVLATGGAKRIAQLPDVPTMAEAGVPGYDVTSWFAVFAPAGTNPSIIERLNRDIRAVAVMPETATMLAASGVVPQSSSPEDLQKLIVSESERWAKLIRDARISTE